MDGKVRVQSTRHQSRPALAPIGTGGPCVAPWSAGRRRSYVTFTDPGPLFPRTSTEPMSGATSRPVVPLMVTAPLTLLPRRPAHLSGRRLRALPWDQGRVEQWSMSHQPGGRSHPP